MNGGQQGPLWPRLRSAGDCSGLDLARVGLSACIKSDNGTRPARPCARPALPCGLRNTAFALSLYAFLVFDSQGNVQCEQSSLPLEAAKSGRDGTIFRAKFGAASCRRIGQSGSPHALLCLCLCRGQCPIGQCWRRRARARRRLGLQSVFKCVVCVVHAFWAFRALCGLTCSELCRK